MSAESSSNEFTDQRRTGSALTETGKRLLLFGGRKWGPISNISIRLSIALGALLLTAGIVYLSRDCYVNDGEIGDLTWIDAFYYATVSLSTTGYGDIAPICQSSRLINVIIITPLRFIFLIVERGRLRVVGLAVVDRGLAGRRVIDLRSPTSARWSRCFGSPRGDHRSLIVESCRCRIDVRHPRESPRGRFVHARRVGLARGRALRG